MKLVAAQLSHSKPLSFSRFLSVLCDLVVLRTQQPPSKFSAMSGRKPDCFYGGRGDHDCVPANGVLRPTEEQRGTVEQELGNEGVDLLPWMSTTSKSQGAGQGWSGKRREFHWRRGRNVPGGRRRGWPTMAPAQELGMTTVTSDQRFIEEGGQGHKPSPRV
jgi:hypothetical protein